MKKSWYDVRAAADGQRARVTIYDEIGFYGISAASFYRDLSAVAKDAEPVDIRISSPGGSVYDGMAIYSMLKGRAGKVTAYVDGIAASIASIVALAADIVVMPENSMMMIHNPFGAAVGDAPAMREQADILDKIAGQMAAIYAQKSGESEETVKAAMAATTWMTGKEAVERGYADVLGEERAFSARFDLSAYASIPPDIAARFAGKPAQEAENINHQALVHALSDVARAFSSIRVGEKA